MWSLGGIRIFVQDMREHTAQIIPRLQPLSGGTVLQVFGHEDDIRTVSGLVVGQADKNDLKDMATGGLLWSFIIDAFKSTIKQLNDSCVKMVLNVR